MAVSFYILIILGLILLWGIFTYNRFISLRRLVGEAWSGISIQLKRRHDLIPNLVESVKGYAQHEKDLLEEVTKMRGSMGNIGDKPTAELAKSESMLGSMIGKVMMVAENYPDLKANTNFLDLQSNLKDIEDQLQMARRYYNGTVRNYMILLESFPSLIIGNIFKFQPEEFFELENPEEEKKIPEVKF